MGWCVFCTWLFHTLLKLNFLHVNGLSESANRRLAQVSIIVIESSTKYAETQVLVDGFHVLTQKHRPTTAVRKAQSVAPHKKQPHRSFMIRKTTLGYLIYFDIAKLEHENHNQLIPLGGTTWNWWLEAFRKKKTRRYRWLVSVDQGSQQLGDGCIVWFFCLDEWCFYKCFTCAFMYGFMWSSCFLSDWCLPLCFCIYSFI